MIQKNYDLLTIGHLNHDYIINIQEFAGVNSSQTIDELKKYDGGTAPNAALVAAEFVTSAFYTIVGEDFLHTPYFKKLRNHDNCLAILEKINDQTSTCFVITDKNTDQKSYIYNGASDKFSYLEPPREYIKKAKIVHITTAPPVFALKCAKYAYEQGILVSFDPGQNLRLYNKKQMIEMLGYVHFLFGNEYEIEYIYNDLNIRVLRNLNVPYMITTRGEKGSLIESSHESEAWYIPAHKVNAVDPTGAGDSYRGAFLAAFLQGCSIDKCGRFASAVSSFVVEKHGCQTNIPTLQQVKERMQNAEKNIKNFEKEFFTV